MDRLRQGPEQSRDVTTGRGDEPVQALHGLAGALRERTTPGDMLRARRASSPR